MQQEHTEGLFQPNPAVRRLAVHRECTIERWEDLVAYLKHQARLAGDPPRY